MASFFLSSKCSDRTSFGGLKTEFILSDKQLQELRVFIETGAEFWLKSESIECVIFYKNNFFYPSYVHQFLHCIWFKNIWRSIENDIFQGHLQSPIFTFLLFCPLTVLNSWNIKRQILNSYKYNSIFRYHFPPNISYGRRFCSIHNESNFQTFC